MSKKLTVVKILASDDPITQEDVEKWRKIFAEKSYEWKDAVNSGDVSFEQVTVPDDNQYITLVKIGDETHHPSVEDLEAWREIFRQAKDDPDFAIFTHQSIDISVINIGKIVAIE